LSDEDEQKICHNCVGETHLSSLIEQGGEVATCDYCGDDEEPCITLDELADHIEGAFERHYYRTSDQPDMFEDMMLRDKESSFEWYRHGEPVLYAVQEAASIEEEVAKDVLEILEDRHSDFDSAMAGEECEFGEDTHYEQKGANDREFAFEWQAIERSLKAQARYFNQGAEDFLARLFADLDGRVTREGHPVVVDAGEGTAHESFFRARVIHGYADFDNAMMRPDLHLGPPPAPLARAGRMNAHGIAVFYGATDKSVALAEVRPPVGSRALVAEFKIIKPVRLLDVTALESVFVDGSIFDPAFLQQLSLAKFMKRLSDRITMPVMPDDEPTEYLITQMIADYLARKPAPGLDGILFRSVQSPGDPRNVVLFHHASRAEALDIPEGTELGASQDSWTEDGSEPDYDVWERVPPATKEEKAEPGEDGLGLFAKFEPADFNPDADVREPTLRVLTKTVTAHHVMAVSFETSEFAVARHRVENFQPKFAKQAAPIEIDDDPF
jgi:hypothetical protein